MSGLPAALAPMVAERRWLVWRWETSAKGKRTKVPYRAADPGAKASSTDPATWGDYATAAAAVAAGKADGIGYALMSGEVGAFDLDDALNEDGEPLPWARELILECDSYVERTVGGSGLRILGTATGEKIHRNQKVCGTPSKLETYRVAERYIVVTGMALDGYGGELRNIDGPIDRWVSKLDEAKGAARAQAERVAADAGVDYRAAPLDAQGNPTGLPPGLDDLVRNGVEQGRRSDEFMHAVGWLKDLGFGPDGIEELFIANPAGIAERYTLEGRLRAQVDHCFSLAKVRPPFDVSAWFEGVAEPRMRIIRPTEYQGVAIPPRRWLVRDWAPWGYVTGLYGEGGLGKSLAAQQLQTATALGRPWFGLETAPVRSLGFYCEDSEDELWRRQAEINRHFGCDFRDLDAARWTSRLGDDNILIRFSARTGTAELTRRHAEIIEEARDDRAELVNIDTVSDTFGGNENDRGQVRAYVSYCLGGIARAIGGSVLCLAHPSRAGIASGSGDGGSTGWSAAFRSRLALQMPTPEKADLPDPDARLLSRKKANYAAREDVVKLRWRAGALVLDAPAEIDRRSARPCADVFLALLDETNRQKRNVTHNAHAGNHAPKQFAKHPNCEGWKAADFAVAMERLFALGAIRVEAYGRKSDERQRIVRTAAEPAEAAA